MKEMCTVHESLILDSLKQSTSYNQRVPTHGPLIKWPNFVDGLSHIQTHAMTLQISRFVVTRV